MPLSLTYSTYIYAINTSRRVLFRKMWKNMEKSVVFSGGYGGIGEILHRQI